MVRIRALVAASLMVTVTSTGGSAAAATGDAGRLTGADAAHSAEAEVAAADTIVALPDLGITHRLSNGAMNLFRIPLSELEDGYGQPQLVRRMDPAAGFSFDRSRVMAGDFGDITAGDDGTANHVIWHAAGDGSVRVWAVAGGSDTRPRLWHTLRPPWSWANSRPMVGDVNGDGWDDLVVRHKMTSTTANAYVFLSDGQRLGAPQWWYPEDISSFGFDGRRHLLANSVSWVLTSNSSINDDGREDWWIISPAYSEDSAGKKYFRGVTVHGRLATYINFENFGASPDIHWFGSMDPNWSYPASRQLVGDVTGDGENDLVTVHQTGNGGLRVWRNSGPYTEVLWADLRTGGWSYAGSRQYLADTNGDFLLDLISVHRSSTGGLVVWRHVSDGSTFAAPEMIADLRTGGWNWSASRESVADTYGVLSVP